MLTNIRRFDFLDRLEIFQADGYQEDFPLHLHEKVCITLTTQGTECTQVHDQDLITPYQGISLTYADEVHANPNRNNGMYSFLTYYISPEVIAHLYGSDRYFFKSRVIQDKYLYDGLLGYAMSPDPTEGQFTRIFESLLRYHFTRYENHTIGDELTKSDLKEAIDFIDANFSGPIPLQDLAKMKDMSRFSFIRHFKKIKGITPAQYITLRRIEATKKKLLQGNTIIDSALGAGFYDQSHMSRNFKKMTGITPRKYQKACNIVQE